MVNQDKFQVAFTELELVQRNSILEKENKQLRKEARIREENLIRSNEAFKEEVKQQAETTNKMLKEMMEMFQKQVKP
jgi:hypothetical protein